MSTTTITFKGIELVVTFDYEAEERQSFDCPGYPAQCDVLTVVHKDEDITELLDWEMVDAISEKVMEEIGTQYEEAVAEARWDRQQERIAEGDYL